MKREATISLCGSYRYDLTRTVQQGCICTRCEHAQPTSNDLVIAGHRWDYKSVLWVLCNPSIADGEVDDSTERRSWGFTSLWGFKKMVFVNVNPRRSTNPREALVPGELIQAHNDGYLMRHAIEASLIICAWGAHDHKGLAYRAQRALRSVAPEKIHTLGLTKGGTPKHPLYLKADTKPQRWVL